jgi:hypothetical protein
MAISYWNSDTSTTAGSSAHNYYSSTSTTGSTFTWSYPVRRILIPEPDTWDDDDTMGFVELINEKTNTGWMVTMLIKGDVLITDPNIETREMKDFIPLLKFRANSGDKKTINDFFEADPIE